MWHFDIKSLENELKIRNVEKEITNKKVSYKSVLLYSNWLEVEIVHITISKRKEICNYFINVVNYLFWCF